MERYGCQEWAREWRARRSLHRRLIIALLLLATSPAMAGDVYRWHDAGGQPHFGDLPPQGAHEPQRLPLSLPRALYRVTKVIDGDTLRVRDGGKVRLLGINAPEVAHRERRGEPLGEEARQRLQQLVTGKRVYLQFDEQRRDRYGRLLAHLFLEDGRNINEQLLREGLARALFLQPNMRHLQRYYQIEGEAREARRGIWSLPEFQPMPASKAGQCLKRFCRLQGRVKKIESGRDYIYLHLPGRLRVAIHHDQLEQFEAAGIAPASLQGRSVTVRGWIASRRGSPYLRLHHPLQLGLVAPQ